MEPLTLTTAAMLVDRPLDSFVYTKSPLSRVLGQLLEKAQTWPLHDKGEDYEACPCLIPNRRLIAMTAREKDCMLAYTESMRSSRRIINALRIASGMGALGGGNETAGIRRALQFD